MDALEFAIQTELDGVKYYSEQSELHKNTELFRVFELLASDEKRHAVILRRVVGESPEELADSQTYAQVQNIFEGIGEFKDELRSNPSQLEAYRTAREMEQKSIELYQKLEQESISEKEKYIFNYLIGEEKNHYAIMDELVIRVSRPEEWVEAAEFGEREEY
jgi:rubrerythrin